MDVNMELDIRECLSYNPETGILSRKSTGREVGWPHESNGGKSYRRTQFNNKFYYAHRLIYLYMTGDWPKDEIDHINGDGLDNRWCNLRPVRHLDNNRNSRRYSNNRSGVTGVGWYRRANKWRGRISIEGKQLLLGLFDTIEEASYARKQAEIKYGFHENHGQERPL